MFHHFEINVVLDAGANVGQYAQNLRKSGYAGKLISFEPVQATFEQLCRNAAKDSEWECRKLALGECTQIAEIKVADTMSSFLSRADTASSSTNFSTSVTQQVQVEPLDVLRSDLYSPADRVWLKMDVQGYEMILLKGATQTLTEIVGIETEMSLWPTYSGQPNYLEMIAYLSEKGFQPWSFSPGHRDKISGQMIEMDGVFIKRGHSPYKLS